MKATKPDAVEIRPHAVRYQQLPESEGLRSVTHAVYSTETGMLYRGTLGECRRFAQTLEVRK